LVETRRRRIDGVQFDQQVDHPQAQLPRAGGSESEFGGGSGPQDGAVDTFHDVEVAAQHGRIGAQSHHRRHVRVDRREQ
jgi:hypothetical protein